jgi:hypothetical protein
MDPYWRAANHLLVRQTCLYDKLIDHKQSIFAIGQTMAGGTKWIM